MPALALALIAALTGPAAERHCRILDSGALACDAEGAHNLAANLRDAEEHLATLQADVTACRALATVNATEAQAQREALGRQVVALEAALARPAPIPWGWVGAGVGVGAAAVVALRWVLR